MTAASIERAHAPRRINRPLAAFRKARAVELAVEGRTYEQIARQVGYSNRGTAYKVVRKALNEQTADAVSELRQVEGERLNALQAALWDRAMAGDLDAARAVLRIIEQRCRLFGLFNHAEAKIVDPSQTTVVMKTCEGPA